MAVIGLLDADGITELSLTPGSAATGEPGGTIPKAQFKAFYDTETATDTSSTLLYTRNLKALTGTSLTLVEFNDLARNQRLQVQANVTGIDPNRTDVVTVETHVKLRPDPKVIKRTGLTEAHVGVRVDIGALVREVNGDVGAIANCVLYIDNVEADRIQGLWIDASSAVDCTFSHIFGEPGVYKLRIVVESVVPRDYDSSNNVYEGEIEILDPTYRLASFGEVSSGDEIVTHRSHTEHRTPEYEYRSDYEFHQEYRYQNFTFSSWAPVAAALAAGDTVTFSEAQDGALPVVGTDTLSDDRIWGYSYSGTTWVYDEARNIVSQDYVVSYVYIDIYVNGARGQLYTQQVAFGPGPLVDFGQTQCYLYRSSGEVTYYSRASSYYRFRDGHEEAERSELEDQWSWGDPRSAALTDRIDFQLDVLSDRTYSTGPQTILLESYEWDDFRTWHHDFDGGFTRDEWYSKGTSRYGWSYDPTFGD